MNDGGKGSKPRPYSVTREEYDDRWDKIFSKDRKSKQEKALDDLVRITEDMGLYDDPIEDSK